MKLTFPLFTLINASVLIMIHQSFMILDSCDSEEHGISYRLGMHNIYIDIYVCVCVCIYIYIYISGGPLSALTCCVNARLLSAIKKISPLIYSQSWVGSWVYTMQAMMTFTLIF